MTPLGLKQRPLGRQSPGLNIELPRPTFILQVQGKCNYRCLRIRISFGLSSNTPLIQHQGSPTNSQVTQFECLRFILRQVPESQINAFSENSKHFTTFTLVLREMLPDFRTSYFAQLFCDWRRFDGKRTYGRMAVTKTPLGSPLPSDARL